MMIDEKDEKRYNELSEKIAKLEGERQNIKQKISKDIINRNIKSVGKFFKRDRTYLKITGIDKYDGHIETKNIHMFISNNGHHSEKYLRDFGFKKLNKQEFKKIVQEDFDKIIKEFE